MLPPSPLPKACENIQAELDDLDTEIDDVMTSLSDGEILVKSRPGMLKFLQQLRLQRKAKANLLNTCILHPENYALTLAGVEATQAVQDMSGSIPLFANKRTVVRVYFNYVGAHAITVKGHLTLSGLAASVGSENQTTLDPADTSSLSAKRNDVTKSLNFVIPPAQTTSGTLHISLSDVTETGTGHAVSLANLVGFDRNLTFQQTVPMRVRFLVIQYKANTPPATFQASNLDMNRLNSWLLRAYPISQLISTSVVVTSNFTPPFDCNQINSQVAAIRGMDISGGGIDKRTHYFGLVGDGGYWMRGCSGIPSSPDPSAVGSGPTGPNSWGWDFDGAYGDWYTGHELGHTYGRFHPGFCGQDQSDTHYPFPNGQLAGSDDAFVGFDVGDPTNPMPPALPLTALPGTVWHDVMTYCSNQWLSSYTYMAIHQRLTDENSLPASGHGMPDLRVGITAAAGNTPQGATTHTMTHVVAIVNLSKQAATLEYVQAVNGGQATGITDRSSVSLRFLDGTGQTLIEYPALVKPSSCTDPGQDQMALVDSTLPLPVGAQSLVLLIDGNVAARHDASVTAPQVQNLRKVEAGTPFLSLEWDSAAAEQDRHRYSVQVSTDEGKTWFTVAVGLDQPKIDIDRTQFEHAGHIQARVISTDGFSTSVVSSQTLQFP